MTSASTEIDWSEFAPMTMTVFLERFTLHDSWLKEVVVGSGGELTFAIGIDLHWNNTVPRGYDTRLLRFDRSYSQRYVQGSRIQPTISHARSEVLSAPERERLLQSS